MEGEETITEERKTLLQVGAPAPDFEALTTHGKIKLSDYRGKWVILFSHPEDFTPVCTTEFIGFAERFGEFKKRNVELIGLSVDSISSHISWVMNIEEKFGVEIPFPIIADVHMKISNLYGMIHGKFPRTLRCVFIIDPEGILRGMFFYPREVGRNIDEIIRIMDALQVVDENDVATPANWKPGDPVIVPPPTTQEKAKERLKEGYECKDWYFCLKKL